jgi:hypothetical protein
MYDVAVYNLVMADRRRIPIPMRILGARNASSLDGKLSVGRV